MAVRFEGTSAGVKGTTYTVQVHDSDFAGTKVDVSLGGDGFRLSYEPEEDSPDVAIIPSTLSFSIIRTSENAAAFNSFLSDFATADEGRFTVRILSGSNLYWCGYLLADQVRYLDTRWADTNAEFAMKAKDGINRLKGINYNDDGTAYEGRVTFKEHLFNILDKIGLQDFWGATDDYLHSVVRWYEEDDTAATLSDNSIDRVYGDHRAAYEVGDNGTYVYKSSFEILEAICTTFGARFFQSDGKWHFIQFNEFRQTGSIYLHRYYKDGTKPGTSSSVDFEVDETGGDFITASEGVQFFIPPVGRVEVEFKHKDDRNYLQGETIVFEVDSTIPGVPGNNSKYRISGLFTSDVEFTNNHLPVFNVVGLKIEIRDQSANVYRLERIAEITGGTNINYGDTQWVEDGLNEYQIVMPIQQSGLPVTQSFDFVTPDSPAGTDSATLLITYFDNRQVVIGNIFNTAVDTVTISASGLSFQAMNTNGTFPAASNLLTLTNPDTPGASAIISKEVIFSDRINFTSSGSITRLVGDEHINTLSWSKGLSGTNYPIRRLLAIELLYQRRKAIKSIDATFISINDFHFFNLLKLNTGEQYVPIRATYNSKREDWAGRYFSIGYSDTLTGVTVINDVPLGPNGQPGGGGTPPGEGPITIPGVSANNPIGSSFDDGGHIVSTTGDSSYSDGDEVTTIGIDTATVDGLVQAGDTIAMIDRTTGNTQTFTVTSNLQAGDTTIAVSSATISGSFGTNSYVTLGTGEFVTNIRQGSAARYVQKFDNPASATLTVTENSGTLPSDTNLIDVFYNGVLLSETDDYSISGSDIVLTFMPKRRVIVKFWIIG